MFLQKNNEMWSIMNEKEMLHIKNSSMKQLNLLRAEESREGIFYDMKFTRD